MPERLLTARDVSERVNRSMSTLKYWRKNGLGPPSFMIEGRVMYRESVVDEWIRDVTTVEEEKATA